MITIKSNDHVLASFAKQLRAIGDGQARRVMARAVNRTTTSAKSRVIRAVAKQSSIPRPIVVGAVKHRTARVSGTGAIEGVIWAKGAPLSLKHFRPRQTKIGTTVIVYGKREIHAGAFMGPRPGVIAPRLGGHVFEREGKDRTPISLQTGPSVPEEMVRDLAEREFHNTVEDVLPRRLAHEIGRILNGQGR